MPGSIVRWHVVVIDRFSERRPKQIGVLSFQDMSKARCSAEQSHIDGQHIEAQLGEVFSDQPWENPESESAVRGAKNNTTKAGRAFKSPVLSFSLRPRPVISCPEM